MGIHSLSTEMHTTLMAAQGNNDADRNSAQSLGLDLKNHLQYEVTMADFNQLHVSRACQLQVITKLELTADP